MTERTLRTDDGCLLAFDQQGPEDAEAIVLVHALGLDRSLWDEVGPALAARWRVVRLDLRGHGRSDVPPSPWSLDRLGQDVIAVMDGLAIRQAHVAGVSLGGLVALWLGIHAGARARSLTLANTAARFGTAESWDARIATVRAHGVGPVADAAAPRWFTPSFLASHPARVGDCVERLRATSVPGYLVTCGILRDADLRARASEVTVPVSVIGGTSDVATPPCDAEWLAAAIPGAALHLLEAGHLSNVERPAEFLAAMQSALT